MTPSLSRHQHANEYIDPDYANAVLWSDENFHNNLKACAETRTPIFRVTGESIYHQWLKELMAAGVDCKPYQCKACKQSLESIATLVYFDTDKEPRSLMFHSADYSAIPAPYRQIFESLAQRITTTARDGGRAQPLTKVKIDTYGRRAKDIFDGNYYHFGTTAPVGTLLTHSLKFNTRDVSPEAIEQTARMYTAFAPKVDAVRRVYRPEDFSKAKAGIEEIFKRLDEYNAYIGDKSLWYKVDVTLPRPLKTLLNTLAGKVFMDIAQGDIDYRNIVKEYAKLSDPRYYQRPSRLPSAPQLDADLKLIQSLGLTDALDCRIAIADDLSPYLDWKVPEAETIKESFGDRLRDKVTPTEKPKLEILEMEGISFNGFRTELKELIERGIVKTICVDPRSRQLIIGSMIVGKHGTFGKLRKDGSNIAPFYFGSEVARDSEHLSCKFDRASLLGLLQLNNLPGANPTSDQIVLVHRGEIKQAIPLPLFPEDLKSEYHHLGRTIEAYAKEYPVNVNSEDLATSTPNDIVIQPIHVGSEVVIETDAHVIQYRIMCIR